MKHRFGKTDLAIRAGMLLAWSLVALAGCGNDAVFSGHFSAFGGQVDVTIVGVPRHEAQEAVEALAEDFRYMEQAWRMPSGSTLERTNQLLATGERFSASPSVLPLVATGRQLAAASGGLLNPALGGLLRLWGFYRADVENFQPPAAEAVAALLDQNPSMDDITVEGFHLRSTNPAVALDFNGFLKGYVIDQAIAHLRERGIGNAMLNAGGDLRAIGSRAGHPWRAPLRRPDGTGVMATVDVEGDESVISVGAYERYLTSQGTHYHHILDPRTGRPAHRTRSVTVIHPRATIAHAAATALFIAGPEAWPRVAAGMGVDQVLLMDTDGVLHMTPRLKPRLRFLGKKPAARIAEPPASDNGTT
jgi:thiamine biosynthesis lipoprotein